MRRCERRFVDVVRTVASRECGVVDEAVRAQVVLARRAHSSVCPARLLTLTLAEDDERWQMLWLTWCCWKLSRLSRPAFLRLQWLPPARVTASHLRLVRQYAVVLRCLGRKRSMRAMRKRLSKAPRCPANAG